MYDFSGKIVAITGAAKGLGATMAKRFLNENAQGVALLDLDEKRLHSTKTGLDPDGLRTFASPCDVSDTTSVDTAFEQVLKHFGRVDILINNAGITRDSMAKKMTAGLFDPVVQISLNGSFYCTSKVLGPMIEQRWGRIIFLSSMAAFGNVGQSNYAAAKAGLIGMAKTMALETASKNITVNCIAPGLVRTDIIKTIPENHMAMLIDKIPMKRIGEPEEVAALAAFLASDEAAYISGQCIKLSGGMN